MWRKETPGVEFIESATVGGVRDRGEDTQVAFDTLPGSSQLIS